MEDYFELLNDEDQYLEMLTELGSGTLAVGGAVAGNYAGRKLGVSGKTRRRMTLGGAAAGVAGKKLQKHMKDRKRDAMQMAKYKAQGSEEVSEDSFARMTARSVGKFAGKAKKAANVAKRASDFEAARKKWNLEKK